MTEGPLRFPILGIDRPTHAILLTLVAILCGCATQKEKNPVDPVRQVNLGNSYSSGTWMITKNDETAAMWYRKAALQGNNEGEYHLGVCYDRGLGVPKNDLLAVEWYTKSARQGTESAQYQLGSCYRLGKGVKPNLVNAYLWFNLAAASGNANAAQARDAVAHRMSEAEIQLAERLSHEAWNRCR